MPDELCFLSAAEVLRRFRDHSLSPVELLAALIRRAEQVEDIINALCLETFEQAMDQARQAERAWMNGTARELEGVPLAVKDEAFIAGRPTTNGSLLLKDFVAKTTDISVQRLLDAGAVVHARTTTPEFSFAFVTCSKQWGVTRNPWNPEITPGGSSGGSAAALSSGTTTLATASDIAGSIRVPASMCGLAGFKPSHGRVPQSQPFNLDPCCHEGPLARTVEDCRRVYNIIAGPHPGDLASLAPKLEIPERLPDIRGWRIACSMDLGYQSLDEDVRRNTRAALDVLRDAGAVVEEVDLGWSEALCRETAMIDYSLISGEIMRREYGSPDQLPLLTAYIRHMLTVTANIKPSDAITFMTHSNRMYRGLAEVLDRNRLLVTPTTATTRVAADFDYSRDGLEIGGRDVDPLLGWVLTHPFNVLGRCPVFSLPSGIG